MDFGKYMTASWRATLRAPGQLVAATLIAFALTTASLGILGGALIAGLMGMYLDAHAKRPVEVGSVFRYLSRTFALWFGHLVVAVLVGVGLLLLIVPGLLFLSWWSYAPMLMAERGMGLGEAMRLSQQAVRREGTFTHLLFVLILVVIGGSGGIFWGVGTLVTFPFAYGAFAIAYTETCAPERG